MKPFLINSIAGLVCVIMGLWGYLSAADPSFTALIPVVFGIILLALTPGMRRENKVVAHIVVVLTLILLISLGVKPLPRVLGEQDNMGIFRVISMMAVCTLAMIIYIKSFIDARKK